MSLFPLDHTLMDCFLPGRKPSVGKIQTMGESTQKH